jgi:hypothetical protein
LTKNEDYFHKKHSTKKEKLLEKNQKLVPSFGSRRYLTIDTIPKIAYLACDDFSSNLHSNTAHSITSILIFNVEEIKVNKTTFKTNPPTTEVTPSGLTEPIVQDSQKAEIILLKEKIQQYKKELEKYTSRIEGFQVVLKTIISKVSQIPPIQSELSTRRPK